MTNHQKKLKVMRKRLREDEQLRRESAQLSIDILSIVPVFVMREQFRWGAKRLTRFIDRYGKIISDIANNKVTPNALADQLYEETGIKYENGSWIVRDEK